MNNIKTVVVGVVAGAVITLATGLLQVTPVGLVGASWYGYPEGWLIRRVLAPQYNPWYVNYPGLITDLVAWIVLALIVLLAIQMMGKKGKRGKR